jgi:hypothetical protein
MLKYNITHSMAARVTSQENPDAIHVDESDILRAMMIFTYYLYFTNLWQSKPVKILCGHLVFQGRTEKYLLWFLHSVYMTGRDEGHLGGQSYEILKT